MGKTIVITSGKGGTGKTSMVCGVAACLAAMNHRVLCLDLDVGLRNPDIALGMSDRVLMDFSDVLYQRCTLEEAVVEHQDIKNLFLLTAPLGIRASKIDSIDLMTLLGQIKRSFDYCLIDSPAGIGSGFELASIGADRAIVVSTTEPASLRDAQQAVRLLMDRNIPIHLVVNKMSKSLLRRLHTTIDDAMDTAGLPLLGIVPQDDKVPICNGLGQSVILKEKRGAAIAYYNIARRLTGQRVPLHRF
jgi:septum site-determining protein MinD